MRDLRDPLAVGRTLLQVGRDPERNVALSEIADHVLRDYPFPNVRGDETPVEKYDRTVETIVTIEYRRVPRKFVECEAGMRAAPIERLAG
jgi:hypothetical protein